MATLEVISPADANLASLVLGIPVNTEASVVWYAQACERGYAPATRCLVGDG